MWSLLNLNEFRLGISDTTIATALSADLHRQSEHRTLSRVSLRRRTNTDVPELSHDLCDSID